MTAKNSFFPCTKKTPNHVMPGLRLYYRYFEAPPRGQANAPVKIFLPMQGYMGTEKHERAKFARSLFGSVLRDVERARARFHRVFSSQKTSFFRKNPRTPTWRNRTCKICTQRKTRFFAPVPAYCSRENALFPKKHTYPCTGVF